MPLPYARPLVDSGDGTWCQLSGGAKVHRLRNIIGIFDWLEDPVDDAAMVMNMAAEAGTEAVDEAHRFDADMRAYCRCSSADGPR
ncbi:MAG: hypothetical protein N838_22030 [Thiohalocapsa sp. PB-PSB1]|nr:MAG: hypothetical protein N838_22030 [Thiohalocapsa sp. PB-PSB1]